MPRRSPQQSITLTAAAKRINMREPKAKAALAKPSTSWQKDAWIHFEIPEIKESIRYRGNQLAKVRLYVAVRNPNDPDGDPIPASDKASGVPPAVAAAADAELARLKSSVGGQPAIMRNLDMNLEVAGECSLVGTGERMADVMQRDGTTKQVVIPEDWNIRSVSEVEVKGSGERARYYVKSDENDTKGVELDPDLDTIIRIWIPDPQWSNRPDSTMRGLLTECQIVQLLTQQIIAHCYRALSAGILTVPNELSRGPAQPTDPEADAYDPIMDALDIALAEPIENPSGSATVQPALLRGEAEYLKPDVLRIIRFYDPEIINGLEARIEARLVRVFRGLNLPVEKIEGHMRTTFANAKQIDEDEYEDYLQPSADVATQALTYAFLRPQLAENPAVPAEWVDQLFITGDPSDLFSTPDTEANADSAWDRGTISDESYRKAKGFGDDDAPEPLELLIRAALKGGRMSADVTLAILNMMGVPLDVEPGAAGQDPNPPAVTASVVRTMHAIRAASRPVSNDYGRRLTELDRELRTRLLSAANVAMGQALDRAANRLRTKTNGSPVRASLQSVPRRSWFAQLGTTLVAEAMGDEDPLEGAWDGLEDDFMAWGADAQAQARSVAAQATGRDQSDLEPRQADDLSNAWLWLAGALTTLAVAKLWTPDPSAPDIGEHDPSLMIPAGLVRQAIARAGGATGLSTSGTDAWVTLTDGGTRPAGGIGTGETIRGALRDGGAQVEGYVWRYGPAFRRNPFDPHLALDGQSFVSFDDDVLASDGTFGFSHWMPGDHAGDLCDCEPVILAADER